MTCTKGAKHKREFSFSCQLRSWSLPLHVEIGIIYITIRILCLEFLWHMDKVSTCPKCGNQNMTYDTGCDPVYFCTKCNYCYEEDEIIYRPSYEED